jgi:tetratricopeptide (TPR) repeat protein
MAQKTLPRHPKRLTKPVKPREVAVETLPPAIHSWHYALLFFGAIIIAFQLYAPALHGQFVFDDLFLTYTDPKAATLSLARWCGLRPILGLSFWANFQIAGLDPFPYHAVNVLLHSVSAILVFLIVRKLLELAGTVGDRGKILAGFAATIFLIHPVQTEAVAYIASRSENLSVFFMFAAFCLFLYRRSEQIQWPESTGILILFACAVGTKEHALALPAVFLLTDYFFNPGYTFSGIRANWRLYAPILVIALAATLFVWSYISRDPMIGFQLQDLTWYQYFFTQCRVFFSYIWLFLVPFGLNVDHQFSESHTLFDHGAIMALAGIVWLIAVAYLWRRRYPLAAYGLLVFVVLLAPTSSFIPIRDVFVERRLYLPFIGLLLIALEPLRRIEVPQKILALMLACICLVPAYLTWKRAAVWNSPIRLWENSVANAPQKTRPHIGLGNAYMHLNRCNEAVREYRAAYQLDKPDFTLKYNLATAFDCVKQPERAIPLLTEAISEKPESATAHALMGMVLAETGNVEEGLTHLNQSEKLDPNFAVPHAYRGVILTRFRRPDLAIHQFEIALQLDPNNQVARKGWTELKDAGQ